MTRILTQRRIQPGSKVIRGCKSEGDMKKGDFVNLAKGKGDASDASNEMSKGAVICVADVEGTAAICKNDPADATCKTALPASFNLFFQEESSEFSNAAECRADLRKGRPVENMRTCGKSDSSANHSYLCHTDSSSYGSIWSEESSEESDGGARRRHSTSKPFEKIRIHNASSWNTLTTTESALEESSDEFDNDGDVSFISRETMTVHPGDGSARNSTHTSVWFDESSEESDGDDCPLFVSGNLPSKSLENLRICGESGNPRKTSDLAFEGYTSDDTAITSDSDLWF